MRNKATSIVPFGDEYITSKKAMKIFKNKTDTEKIKILIEALKDKCESKEHTEYMILKYLNEVAYTDLWCDDKNGFYYKKIK